MKIYDYSKSVVDAAYERIKWLCEEFEVVAVSVSGGKDSTVCFYLALEVLERFYPQKLPMPVVWLDQEAEWRSTVEVVERMMLHDRVLPVWVQCPCNMFSASSYSDVFLRAWDPEAKELWIHPQHPVSIKENRYRTERFYPLLRNIPRVEFAGKTVALIAGMRAQENVARAAAFTSGAPKYKWVTWCKEIDRKQGQYNFYPLYDWLTTDVWKFIAERGLPYNSYYDKAFRLNAKIDNLRVSNLVHETGVNEIPLLPLIEPETFGRLTLRLQGIATTEKLHEFLFVDELPVAFRSWKEYRDYLVEVLVPGAEKRERFVKVFRKIDRLCPVSENDDVYRTCVLAILRNDYEGSWLDRELAKIRFKRNDYERNFLLRFGNLKPIYAAPSGVRRAVGGGRKAEAE